MPRGRPRIVRQPSSAEDRQAYFDRALSIAKEMADLRMDQQSLRKEFRDEHNVDTSPIDKAVALAVNDTPEKIQRFKDTVAAMEEFNVVHFDASGQGNVFAALEPSRAAA